MKYLVGALVGLVLCTGISMTGLMWLSPNTARPILKRLGFPFPRPATLEEHSQFPLREEVSDAWADASRLGVTAFPLGHGKFIENVTVTFMRHPDLELYGLVLEIQDLGGAGAAQGSRHPAIPPRLAIGLAELYRLKTGAFVAAGVCDLIELKDEEALCFIKKGASKAQITKLLAQPRRR